MMKAKMASETIAGSETGLLWSITGKLAEDGNVVYSLNAATTEADPSLIVFSSANNDQAVLLLND